MIRRIAITGPESTGKSWLAEKLAERYHTVWVPEYAREYLAGLGRSYCHDDILKIAAGQLNHEADAMKTAPGFLFCDTELLVTKIWSEVKYGFCDPWILKKLETHVYDLYLLCDIDLPWEYDPLREHPDRRQFLFDLYYNELTKRKFPFAVVSGTGKARLDMAVNLIEELIV
ncbi:MAG: ATP-binding protein [Bacteroidetes bacterium]|nr:ATP-binding protein [Bacteroidota bacterium]